MEVLVSTLYSQGIYRHFASSIHGSGVRTHVVHKIYLAIPGIHYKIHYTYLLSCYNNWHSQKQRRLFLLLLFSEADAAFRYALLNSSNLLLTYLTQHEPEWTWPTIEMRNIRPQTCASIPWGSFSGKVAFGKIQLLILLGKISCLSQKL